MPTSNTAAAAAMRCPTCGVLQPEGIMCEADGALLVQPGATLLRDRPELGPCPGCGAGVAKRESNGFCRVCGADWTIPHRDRIEVELGPDLAAVTDRCSPATHLVNQDAVWLARGQAAGRAYMVVALGDGVSVAQRAQFASALAVYRTGLGAVGRLEAGCADVGSALRQVILDASRAVRQLPYDPEATAPGGRRLMPPATTLVVAVVWGDDLTLAWLGDSRAYVGGADGLVQRTHDDSWLQRMLEEGASEAEALADPRAHAITRWIGLVPDVPEAPPCEPSVVSLALPAGGAVLLCSDGVWGYLPHAEQMTGLVGPLLAERAPALAVCRRLVDHAIEVDGGSDNATAALIIGPRRLVEP